MLAGSTSSLIVNFSHLAGVSASAKQLKGIGVCNVDGEPGPCPKAALLFLLTVGFSLVAHPLPSLINNCLNCPLELREGHGGRMKPSSCNQRNGGHRKVFVSRSPTGSGSGSSWPPKPSCSPLPKNHHQQLLPKSFLIRFSRQP